MDFNALKTYTWEGLKRSDLGVTYQEAFSQIHSMLSRVSSLVIEFETSLSLFIQTDASNLQNIHSGLITLRDKTQGFSPQPGETGEATQSRASALVVEVRDFYNNSCPKLAEYQMYLREENKKKIEAELGTYKTQSQEIANNTQSTVTNKINELDQKMTQVDQGLQRISEIQTNIEKLDEDVKNFSLTETVAQYGGIFLNQAAINRNVAVGFALLFVTLISGTIYLIVHWFLPLLQELTKPESVQNWQYYLFAFLIRFTVIFIVYILIREVLKNYNTNMRMYHLNSHRNNSLQSFDILVRNNKLPENRDEIVKEISRTIFAHQEDGYLTTNHKEISLSEIASLISAIKK